MQQVFLPQNEAEQGIATILDIARGIAIENSHRTYGHPHLLKALLHQDVGLIPVLYSLDKDEYFLEEWADIRLEQFPKGVRQGDTTMDASLEAVIDEADYVRIKHKKDVADALCLLTALCTPGVGFSFDQLKSLPLTREELMAAGMPAGNMYIPGLQKSNQPSQAITNVLQKYCSQPLKLLQAKPIALTARDKELRMITEILCRLAKPNVLLAGEAGVGKTTLINGFVQAILQKKIPAALITENVFELDTSALLAGAAYKGEAEDRLKHIFKDLKMLDKPILIIDELHILLDKQGAAPGATNILKPAIAGGDITIIATATMEQYRKHIEKDEGLNRQFELLLVEEPDDVNAFQMIKMVIPGYQKHHGISVSNQTITETIRLAKRFVKEKRLPDAGIDLLDRAMAGLRLINETGVQQVDDVLREYDALLNGDETAVAIEDWQWFYKKVRQQLSPVLMGYVTSNITSAQELITIDAVKNDLTVMMAELKKAVSNRHTALMPADVAVVIAAKTGIPLGKLQTHEKERLLNMETSLQQRVVGQPQAVKAITEAILEARSGLGKQGQPMGSFFFLGPTGTGKTELAKALAEFLFQDESFMIRFDMSEFKEEHAAALLYGAPPGYVGYEEGGLLVNKIRKQPYAVVLFDEIEKAHSSVFDVFLQIMDEGKLHDKLGREGDFSNAVIIFTSNIGSSYVVEQFNKDAVPSFAGMMEIMASHFRPEFLGRLTEIVPFAPMKLDVVGSILEIQLKSLFASLEKMGITLLITQQAREMLARQGFTPVYGARPLSGAIRTQVRRPLSAKIISGALKAGDTIMLSINSQQQFEWVIK
jgi:ATP-dependent Clp protease ATP-binding subunit ClpB